jgi:hypothetical protein
VQVQGLGMKSKQLANVLIKIVGISVFLHAIPSFLYGFFYGLFGGILGFFSSTPRSGASSYSLAYPLASGSAGLISIIIAFFVIVKSRQIAEFLFKDEDE